MSAEEKYQGWTNRETWAVALHINNDQGWQESVHEAIRAKLTDEGDDYSFGEVTDTLRASWAGDAIRENVEETLEMILEADADTGSRNYMPIREDMGSMWRVNWTELGASFLSDVEESDEEPAYFGEELHAEDDEA